MVSQALHGPKHSMDPTIDPPGQGQWWVFREGLWWARPQPPPTLISRPGGGVGRTASLAPGGSEAVSRPRAAVFRIPPTIRLDPSNSLKPWGYFATGVWVV